MAGRGGIVLASGCRVDCETVTGVVIGRVCRVSRCRPTGRRARSAGRGLPLGVRDGSVAETWTGAAFSAREADPSASASPVALLS